jgi:catechol 2,3-dioxygenase-like lactoylglutathione lyase family enzyme
MESVVSDLMTRFEKGEMSRRELVRILAMLAAGGAAPAAAQETLDFKTAGIDHVSIRVSDMGKSIDFYRRMFGFTVVGEDRSQGVVRLGATKITVSLNQGRWAPGTIDHFSIGIPKFTNELGRGYFTARGAMPLQGDLAGFHIKDPDGVSVQISQS